MRRRMALMTAIVLAVAIAAPVSAGGNQTFHYAEKGSGVDAFWTTYPVDGAPVAGVIYRETFVSASSTIVRADGAVFAGSGLFVDSFSYKFDKKGTFIPLSETFAFIDGASIALDQKLTGSVVSGSGLADICSIDTSGSYTCTTGTIEMSGTWTGQGPLVRQHGASSWGVAGMFQSTWHGTGSYRAATAVASLAINGTAIAVGANYGADIFSLKSGETDLYVCHGSC